MDISALAVDYFDGRSARAQPAWLRVQQGTVTAWARDGESAAPLAQAAWRTVTWPERTAGGVRIAHWPGGGSVQSADAASWDAWMARHALQRESWVTRAQQSWRGALAALVLLGAGVSALYVWGLPWGARAAVALIPLSVDEQIGASALSQVDSFLLKPSRLPQSEQQYWRDALTRAVNKTYGEQTPQYQLMFRSSRIGPNAFALPGGAVVLTDELVALARRSGDMAEAMVIGVLAHELGHVRARHGMRHLVSSSVLALITSTFLGDFSTLLSVLPLWLGQARYSRAAEREADDEARRLMLANGYSPLAMVRFFELLREEAAQQERKRCVAQAESEASKRAPDDANAAPTPEELKACEQQADEAARAAKSSGLGIAFSSHPADDERIEAFRRAAQ